VTKKDILDYVSNGRSKPPIVKPKPAENVHAAVQALQTPASVPAPTPAAAVAAPPTVPTGNVEVIEMDRMRRLIADHMVKSKATSAHVTSFAEADVTHMVQWRERVKKEFEKREGEKITYTPLMIEAVIKCIRKHPLLNSSVEGDRIIVKRDINLGMATALPSGNLIVPVIKGADQLNLVGLTRQVNQLADRARNNRLKPDDTQGGTFTLTNVGSFGSLMGTPIINQPQVAILATGAIRKRPVVLEGPEGDSIAIRHMMFLSLSYDHRIIDGSLGATFLASVVRELEQFDTNRSL
jgi:2-oxoglutarate dehydrogenase E2 component (dihydrolipoamide succinyltransferase)